MYVPQDTVNEILKSRLRKKYFKSYVIKFVSRICKELLKLNNKNSIKNEQDS